MVDSEDSASSASKYYVPPSKNIRKETIEPSCHSIQISKIVYSKLVLQFIDIITSTLVKNFIIS